MEFLLFMSLLSVDYAQTKHIEQSQGRFIERNPIIREIGADTYFAGIGAASFYLQKRYPRKAKTYFVAASIVQLGNVIANNELGITLRF